MNAELRREVDRWRRYAIEDLEQAEHVLKQVRFVPRHPAWLAQQAAEKAIKAVLIYMQREFPLTHNLKILFGKVPKDWSVAKVRVNLDRLTEFAVEARYPGDLPDVSLEDAKAAVEDASKLVAAVEADLKQRMDR